MTIPRLGFLSGDTRQADGSIPTPAGAEPTFKGRGEFEDILK